MKQIKRKTTGNRDPGKEKTEKKKSKEKQLLAFWIVQGPQNSLCWS